MCNGPYFKNLLLSAGLHQLISSTCKLKSNWLVQNIFSWLSIAHTTICMTETEQNFLQLQVYKLSLHFSIALTQQITKRSCMFVIQYQQCIHTIDRKLARTFHCFRPKLNLLSVREYCTMTSLSPEQLP